MTTFMTLGGDSRASSVTLESYQVRGGRETDIIIITIAIIIIIMKFIIIIIFFFLYHELFMMFL